jgi:hypothetical protein
VPGGTYTLFGDTGQPIGTEEFRCAPGMAGWRCFSTQRMTHPNEHEEIVDISVDSEWNPFRLRIGTGSHHLILQRENDGRFAGARDDEELDMAGITDFDYRSPVFNAVTANRLLVAGIERADLEVTWVEPVTLELSIAPQRYERTGHEEVDTPSGRFAADRWHFTSLDSDWSGDLWVAEDVTVAYPQVAELSIYDPGAGPKPLT